MGLVIKAHEDWRYVKLQCFAIATFSTLFLNCKITTYDDYFVFGVIVPRED